MSDAINKIREALNVDRHFPLDSMHALIRDGAALLYQYARSDIEGYCLSVNFDGLQWFDTDTATAEIRPDVEKACQYLHRVQKIQRMADSPSLVRFVD